MNDLIINWYNFGVIFLGGITTWWCYREYKRTKSRPLLNCLPGVFTSLGLLGTFLSIVISLHGLVPNDTRSTDNSDTTSELVESTGKKDTATKANDRSSNNMQEKQANGDFAKTVEDAQKEGINKLEIETIIGNLIPAFTSSIVGLLCALIVTLWTKRIFAKEDNDEAAQLQNKSPEEYIHEIASNTQSLSFQYVTLKKLFDLHKDEQARNKEYNKKLNDNISKQSEILKDFIDGFVKRMDDVFKTMQGNIQKQVEDFGQEQFSKTSKLLESIANNLSSVSANIIDNQRKSVETMMSNTNTELSTIKTGVTGALNDLSKQIQGSLTSLSAEQLNRLNEILSNYDKLASSLTEQMQKEYQNIQDHNVNSLQQMVALKDAYQEETSKVISNSIIMNEKVTEDLRTSMTGFVTELQSRIATECNSLSSAIKTNVESLNNAYQFIESLVAEIRQNYDQSALAYADAVKNVHLSNESTEKTIKATNDSLSAVEETNQKIDEVLEIMSARQENIEQLTKQISSVSSVIVELQKLESTLNKLANR